MLGLLIGSLGLLMLIGDVGIAHRPTDCSSVSIVTAIGDCSESTVSRLIKKFKIKRTVDKKPRNYCSKLSTNRANNTLFTLFTKFLTAYLLNCLNA